MATPTPQLPSEPQQGSRLPTPAETVRQLAGNAKLPGLTFGSGARGLELWAAPARGDRAAAVYALAPGYDLPLWEHDLPVGHTWTIPSLESLLVELGNALAVEDPALGRSAWMLHGGWVDADSSWTPTSGPQIGPKVPAPSRRGVSWKPVVDGTITTTTGLSGAGDDFRIEMTPVGHADPLVCIVVSRLGLEELPEVSIPRLLYDIARSLDPNLDPASPAGLPHPDSFAGRRARRVIQGT